LSEVSGDGAQVFMPNGPSCTCVIVIGMLYAYACLLKTTPAACVSVCVGVVFALKNRLFYLSWFYWIVVALRKAFLCCPFFPV